MVEAALQRHGIELACASEDVCAVPDDLAAQCVCIDFTTPAAFRANYPEIARKFKAAVVGTTGWYDIKESVFSEFGKHGTPMIWASNFSIGVNAFFAAVQRACEVLRGHGYTPHVEEIHHIHKLDKPSGTAITLAKNVMDCHSRYKDWQLAESPVPATQGGQEAGPRPGNAPIPCPAVPNGILPIVSLREGETVGTHRLFFDSAIDTIELSHTAKSRQGFALGAVMAAEWLPGKTGCFGMQDLLGF